MCPDRDGTLTWFLVDAQPWAPPAGEGLVCGSPWGCAGWRAVSDRPLWNLLSFKSPALRSESRLSLREGAPWRRDARALAVGAAWPEVRACAPPSPGAARAPGPDRRCLLPGGLGRPRWRPSWQTRVRGGRRKTKLRDLSELWRGGRRERVLGGVFERDCGTVGQWSPAPCSVACRFLLISFHVNLRHVAAPTAACTQQRVGT